MGPIKNATIEGVGISNADHGWLSIWVHLDYGDSGHQGFGGYALYNESSKEKKPNIDYTGAWIWGVLKVAGVQNWDHVVGKTVRVQMKDENFNSTVARIGHITKDIWFDPKEIK